MAGLLIKAREARRVLGISRWKLQEMERLGALKRVHLKFRWNGTQHVPVDHGWFKRAEVERVNA